MSGRGYPSSDRQVSDLRPPMTTNESAPDPTVGERMCDCHNPPQRLRSHDDYPATPPADDASEPLTVAEREALSDAVEFVTKQTAGESRMEEFMFPLVERIKAAAATKARAEGVRQFGEHVARHWFFANISDEGRQQIARAATDYAARIARGDA